MTDKEDGAGIEVVRVNRDEDDVLMDGCSKLKVVLSWGEVKK